jgi:hypothetical protein
MVRALDPVLKREAYGARLTVAAGSKRWVQQLNPGFSYLCSNDPRVHFGLGALAHVDSIEVKWPDGLEEVFAGVSADQCVTICKGRGKARTGKHE